MTQPPPTGQRAPVGTDFDAATAPHHPASPDGAGAQSAPAGSRWDSDEPSTASAPSSTPWGTTSTSTSSGSNAYPTNPSNIAQHENSQQTSPHQVGAPRAAEPAYASAPAATAPTDAPTVNVPLVQGARAPLAEPGAKRSSSGSGSHSAPRQPRGARGPRRARLQLRHIDPWTVLKFACVLSIALFFVWLIVVGVLYGVLDGAGVIDKINNTVTTINGGNAKPPISAGIVFGGAAIIGVVNIVLFIALSTVGSVVYNLCADLVGGIEITLSER